MRSLLVSGRSPGEGRRARATRAAIGLVAVAALALSGAPVAQARGSGAAPRAPVARARTGGAAAPGQVHPEIAALRERARARTAAAAAKQARGSTPAAAQPRTVAAPLASSGRRSGLVRSLVTAGIIGTLALGGALGIGKVIHSTNLPDVRPPGIEQPYQAPSGSGGFQSSSGPTSSVGKDQLGDLQGAPKPGASTTAPTPPPSGK